MQQTTITLRSGKLFDLVDPSHNDFSIDDLAHALANTCRFCGHTAEYYSVAQHCVLVSTLVPREYALAGLLHDATEAFIGHAARPIKTLLPDYRQVESRIEDFIYARFGLNPRAGRELVTRANMLATITEQRYLLHGPDPDLMAGYTIEPLPERLDPLPPKAAKELFIQRFKDIRAQQAEDAAEAAQAHARQAVTANKRPAVIFDPHLDDLIDRLHP